jgi:hypothetical protein
MAMLSNRTGEVVATEDENADGRLDQHDDRIAAKRSATATKAAPAKLAPARPAPAADAPVVPATKGPRPRASLTATLSLILGVVAALSVLTGVLAGPGVAVGLLAALAGLVGVAASSRRHVAGKTDAFLGIALGIGAIVIGVLVLTGNLSWLDGHVDQVMRVHGWLAVHLPWLLPKDRSGTSPGEDRRWSRWARRVRRAPVANGDLALLQI